MRNRAEENRIANLTNVLDQRLATVNYNLHNGIEFTRGGRTFRPTDRDVLMVNQRGRKVEQKRMFVPGRVKTRVWPF